jgi:hypothetical protein
VTFGNEDVLRFVNRAFQFRVYRRIVQLFRTRRSSSTSNFLCFFGVREFIHHVWESLPLLQISHLSKLQIIWCWRILLDGYCPLPSERTRRYNSDKEDEVVRETLTIQLPLKCKLRLGNTHTPNEHAHPSIHPC